MRKKVRRGFTLFHLLVLLALLAILFAMLLPALAKAHLNATRMASANNLKQIGLACHNYHASFGTLPPGVDAESFSAAARLLPFIEQDAVFKLIDFKKSVDDPANAATRKLSIQVFLNPLDSVRSVTPDYGATNYLFNAGSKATLTDNNGIFYRDSKIKLEKIPDGTSNTLFTVETLKGDGGVRAVDVRRQHVRIKAADLKGLTDESGVAEWKADKNIAANRCASWMDGRFLQGTFTATRTLNDPRPDVDCGGQGGLSAPRSMTDGVYAGMCDGSVRTITRKTTPIIWRYLADRADGNVIPNTDF